MPSRKIRAAPGTQLHGVEGAFTVLQQLQAAAPYPTHPVVRVPWNDMVNVKRVLDIGAPRFTPDGWFAGYIGSAVDVTEQKAAREALSGLSGRLAGSAGANR